jgi:hypothetical protein
MSEDLFPPTVKMRPAFAQTEGHGAPAHASRPCPGCEMPAMRADSVCCAACWETLPGRLRVQLWLAETVAEYTAAGAAAMKALGCDRMALRIPPRLPREELATGWEGRYAGVEAFLGRTLLSLINGKIKLHDAGRAKCIASGTRTSLDLAERAEKSRRSRMEGRRSGGKKRGGADPERVTLRVTCIMCGEPCPGDALYCAECMPQS